jgi:hypothetical protein
MLPTGKDSTNYAILIVACKCGAAAEAAIHVLSSNLLKLALEVVARTGFGIVQRCSYALRSNDPTLALAAIRCLIGIGEARSFPIDRMKVHIESRNTTLQLAAYLAVATAAENNVQLPFELIDICSARAKNVRLAGEVVISACTWIENARRVIGKIESAGWEPEFVGRILLKARKHEELRASILEILNNENICSVDAVVAGVLNEL